MPRDDSTLVATTVHPVIFGAPRPKTGRRCEAGFLAPGSSPSPAFPIIDQWQFGRLLAGYSCGGSRGLPPRSLHLAPGASFCGIALSKATGGCSAAVAFPLMLRGISPLSGVPALR